MRVCDICKTNGVKYETVATTNDKGQIERLELCGTCYMELDKRKKQHEHLAYIETVKAINGEIPHKSHWWDKLLFEEVL